MNIRSTVKAIIVHDNRLLLLKNKSRFSDFYYTLPGGGQQPLETFEEALKREVGEETGYDIKVLKFLSLFEEISDCTYLRENHPDYVHKIYHIFLCKYDGMKNESCPPENDVNQTGHEWIDLKEIGCVNIFPLRVREQIKKILAGEAPFIGSVHTDNEFYI